jgi:acetyl esterase/lipase
MGGERRDPDAGKGIGVSQPHPRRSAVDGLTEEIIASVQTVPRQPRRCPESNRVNSVPILAGRLAGLEPAIVARGGFEPNRPSAYEADELPDCSTALRVSVSVVAWPGLLHPRPDAPLNSEHGVEEFGAQYVPDLLRDSYRVRNLSHVALHARQDGGALPLRDS